MRHGRRVERAAPGPFLNLSASSSLIPVVLLIGIGFIAGRAGWIRLGAIRDLSNLVFFVLGPALLFRSMSGLHIEQFDFKPSAVFFAAALGLFFGVFLLQGASRRGAVLALAAMYGNLVMIGIPLVGLAYGDAGLATLLPLISLHALVVLSIATIVLELAAAREAAVPGSGGHRHIGRTVWLAARNAIIHPVPLPIAAGLLFAQTGARLPALVDSPLQLLGNAFGPMALLLVGITLVQTQVGTHLRAALGLALLKNLLLPTLVLALGWVVGLAGLALSVMVVAAALPSGANAFMFSQRYQVAEELVTASVAVSTALALISLSVVLALLGPA